MSPIFLLCPGVTPREKHSTKSSPWQRTPFQDTSNPSVNQDTQYQRRSHRKPKSDLTSDSAPLFHNDPVAESLGTQAHQSPGTWRFCRRTPEGKSLHSQTSRQESDNLRSIPRKRCQAISHQAHHKTSWVYGETVHRASLRVSPRYLSFLATPGNIATLFHFSRCIKLLSSRENQSDNLKDGKYPFLSALNLY